MIQKQLTPIKRSEVKYTKHEVRKVKEFVQGIDVYTYVQSSKYIQRGKSLNVRIYKGDRMLPRVHKNLIILL